MHDGSNSLISERTCWKRARAPRLAFLVDGAAYYDAQVLAVKQARHSIHLVGWDIHSKTVLRPQANEPCVLAEPVMNAPPCAHRTATSDRAPGPAYRTAGRAPSWTRLTVTEDGTRCSRAIWSPQKRWTAIGIGGP